MTTTIQLSARDATLDTKLSSTPIPRLLRRTIIETIFNYTLREDGFDFIRGLDAYFSDWYEEQCEVAAGYVSVTTHRELLDVITQLQSTTLTRSDVLRKLLQDSPSIDHGLLNGSINLAARLWLTVSLGSVQQSLTPGNTVAWEEGKLSDRLHGALWPRSRLDEKVKLPKTFTAANLERIAGLNVIWTSNLADHLSLKDDDTKVLLFHQTTFLELHEDTQRCAIIHLRRLIIN